MDFITNWISNIIIFIILAIIVDLLLPNSNYQRYVKMVIGLVLLVIILNPVLKIFSIDAERLFQTSLQEQYSQKNIENLVENKKKEIQASNRAYILEQMAVLLTNKAEEGLMDNYEVGIEEIHVALTEENMTELSLDHVEQIQVKLTKKTHSPSSEIEEVKAVVIDVSKPAETLKGDEELESYKAIRSYLSQTWEIDENRISIIAEGGEQQ